MGHPRKRPEQPQREATRGCNCATCLSHVLPEATRSHWRICDAFIQLHRCDKKSANARMQLAPCDIGTLRLGFLLRYTTFYTNSETSAAVNNAVSIFKLYELLKTHRNSLNVSTQGHVATEGKNYLKAFFTFRYLFEHLPNPQ